MSALAEHTMCVACGVARETKPTQRGLLRLPRGWKRIDDEVLCSSCTQDRYVLRAVTLPIAKPLDSTWAEFREIIRGQWSLVSQCMTWMVRELYARDAARAGTHDKLPKMERVYLYPEARERFPGLVPATVSALEQLAQSKYRKQRYGVLWTQEEQLQTLRYPQPLIVPAKNWSIEISPTNARRDIVLTVRIAGAPRQLRLRSGGNFRRQRLDIEKIIAGDAVKGELAIYRKRAAGTDRAGASGQKSSALGKDRGDGGQQIRYDTMVKLVGRFPRKQHAERTGTLYVRTAGESLLVALNAKDEKLWVLNSDHVRRWCAEHMARLNRWSDDAKAELRPTVPFADRRQAAAVKFRNRIHSACLEAAAQLVAYAVRRKFAEVRYNDADKSYVGRFDWSGLKAAIEHKCNADNLRFIDASGAVKSPSREPLESEG